VSDAIVTEWSHDDRVLRARIDRPERRNALDGAAYDGLVAAAEAADGAARALVVEGTGEAFCAGGDLAAMPVGGSAAEYREAFGGLSRVVLALRDTSAVTVAAVDGDCLAGGLGLAATCEFVLASDNAAFGTPEVEVGLFPAQAMVPITRAVPGKRAAGLLFSGETIDAAEAHDMGLVTRVRPAAEFEDALEEFLADLVAGSPTMLAMGKEAYHVQRGMAFEDALAYCRDLLAVMATSEDTEEGIAAFLDDRDPEWADR
jgi:enoyl-CoA hydratase/carnithine racemase